MFPKRSILLAGLLIFMLSFGALFVSAQGGEGVSLEDFELAPRIQEKLDSGEELVIRVSYHDVSNEFAPFLRAGVERAADELGVDANFVGPVGADAEAQIAEIETLLESIDGLAVSSVSTDALAPVIDRAIEMGIPVVTYNTDNPESARLAFAGQDLVQSGREAGQLMCDYLGGEGKVLITTLDAAAQWSIDRETGAREALDACGVEVVATINTGTEPTEIYAAIENAMLANPDVDGVVSMECCSNPAAGEYMVRNGLAGEVLVVGFDLLDQTVELVQEGAIQATIDQAPERQGFEAVNMLVQFLGGETISDVDTGVGIYTAENIAEVLAPAADMMEGISLEDFELAPRIQEKLDSGEELVIRVSYHDVSNEFAPFLRAGVERAADELGVDANFVGPVGADAEAQIAEIETLLESIDGLAVSSVSTDALAPVIDRAIEMGIPVVTYNTDNPESARLAFAGQDLVQSGREAGQLMCDYLGGEGKVLITTLDAAAQWSIDRETGAREALDACGVEVVATINTGTEPTEIYAAIENAMLANPDVDGVVSMECCSNPAAGEYMVRNGLAGEVLVVGFDLLDQTVELVREGAIQATIDQAPERQGFEAVNMLVQFLGGEAISDVDTGVGIYTIDNIDDVAP
jgi:simple sugar transport system substrate-binding protein